MIDLEDEEDINDEQNNEVDADADEDNMEISEDDIIEIETDLIETEETSNVDNIDESESDLDIYFKFGTNNHKLEGKHSLKRDTIFNGKIVENVEESDFGQMGDFDRSFGDSPLERGTLFEEESRNSDGFITRRNLELDVFELLTNKTDIDFKSNRRKPNKIVFNIYYKMLLEEIGKKYSKCDIFVSLAYYFTDNMFNMYKLLDKNYAMGIIAELRDKGYLKDIPSFM